MEAVAGFVKDKVAEVAAELAVPVIGESEDIKRAQELVGDSAKVYAALRVPEDALKISCTYYLLFCILPPLISAQRRLKNTLYIITGEGIKVHVDPYEPFMGIGNADNDNLELSLDELGDIKIVKASGGCMGGADKIVIEGNGMELYVADVDTVGEALKKLKQFKTAAKGAASAAEAVTG